MHPQHEQMAGALEQGQCCAKRASAAEALKSLARRLRDEAHKIEVLADFAGHLPPEADQALWDFAMLCHRRLND